MPVTIRSGEQNSSYILFDPQIPPQGWDGTYDVNIINNGPNGQHLYLEIEGQYNDAGTCNPGTSHTDSGAEDHGAVALELSGEWLYPRRVSVIVSTTPFL